MSNSMLLERSTPAVAPFGQPGTIPSGSPAAANWCVLPRCEISFEKCTGGLKIHCGIFAAAVDLELEFQPVAFV